MSRALLHEHRHRFTRDAYNRIAAAGGFLDPHVELIDGEVVDRLPPNSPHATALILSSRALERAFGAGHVVRPQLPLSLDDHSEPEPDLAVVPGSPRDYRDAHPATALLVVEVAETSLAYDLEVKAGLYSCAGIAEYWVVDLAARRLHVHRGPRPLAREAGYSEVLALGPEDDVTPLAAPDARIRVADLLP